MIPQVLLQLQSARNNLESSLDEAEEKEIENLDAIHDLVLEARTIIDRANEVLSETSTKNCNVDDSSDSSDISEY